MIKVSIIIPVLNSHEIVRRQLAHFRRIGLPDDTELIVVDDGSDPPLDYAAGGLPLRIIATHDKRPWTWALARNRGAREARGKYLLMTDVDHIICRPLLDFVRGFNGQKVQFKREFGAINPDGTFTQDYQVLMSYGLPERRLKDKGVFVPPLPNNFAMRADVFWALGGYREDLVELPYPQGEDRLFKAAWHKWRVEGKGEVDKYRPTIYMFPCGQFCGDVDYNPQGLFHDLSRKTRRNHWHKRILAGNYR